MKKIIIMTILLIIIIVIAIIVFGVNNKNKSLTKNNETQSNDHISEVQEKIEKNAENQVLELEKEEEGDKKVEYLKGKHNIEITIENYGVIKAELDADIAPITVTNFVELVNQGFYNGLTFHRIIEGFMIQGGDPLGNGTGGSKNQIKGEFLQNGVENNISHTRGTLSMARSGMPNSASSQFFIVHEDSKFLDRQYAGFGKVTSGMEIVDKICENTVVQDSNGTVLKENQPKIVEIKIIN